MRASMTEGDRNPLEQPVRWAGGVMYLDYRPGSVPTHCMIWRWRSGGAWSWRLPGRRKL